MKTNHSDIESYDKHYISPHEIMSIWWFQESIAFLLADKKAEADDGSKQDH